MHVQLELRGHRIECRDRVAPELVPITERLSKHRLAVSVVREEAITHTGTRVVSRSSWPRNKALAALSPAPNRRP